MFDVTAVGDLWVEFILDGKNSQNMALYARNPRSSVANILAMNSKLGGRTAFMGKVGRDQLGFYLRETLRTSGIDTTGLILDGDATTTLSFDYGSSRSKQVPVTKGPSQRADLLLTAKELEREMIKTSRILHFASATLAGDPARTAVHSAVRIAKNSGGVISFAPNVVPPLWRSLGQAKREMMRIMPFVDVLKVSEEELHLLTGELGVEQGAKQLMELGPSLVFVTLGANGAFFLSSQVGGTSPAYAVRTIDTRGFGDAFFGAVHYRLRGKDLNQIKSLTRSELVELVDFANAAASLTTTKVGVLGAMPSLEEVETCGATISRVS